MTTSSTIILWDLVNSIVGATGGEAEAKEKILPALKRSEIVAKSIIIHNYINVVTKYPEFLNFNLVVEEPQLESGLTKIEAHLWYNIELKDNINDVIYREDDRSLSIYNDIHFDLVDVKHLLGQNDTNITKQNQNMDEEINEIIRSNKYIQIMISTIIETDCINTIITKEQIIHVMIQKCEGLFDSGLSQHKLEMLASFCRPLEHAKGGHIKQKNES